MRIMIMQIWVNVDMRGLMGPDAAREFVTGRGRGPERYDPGEVFMMLNKRRNILLVYAPNGNGAYYKEELPGKETWDFTLRKGQIFNLIGRPFGLQWNIDDGVYEPVRELLAKGGSE